MRNQLIVKPLTRTHTLTRTHSHTHTSRVKTRSPSGRTRAQKQQHNNTRARTQAQSRNHRRTSQLRHTLAHSHSDSHTLEHTYRSSELVCGILLHTRATRQCATSSHQPTHRTRHRRVHMCVSVECNLSIKTHAERSLAHAVSGRPQRNAATSSGRARDHRCRPVSSECLPPPPTRLIACKLLFCVLILGWSRTTNRSALIRECLWRWRWRERRLFSVRPLPGRVPSSLVCTCPPHGRTKNTRSLQINNQVWLSTSLAHVANTQASQRARSSAISVCVCMRVCVCYVRQPPNVLHIMFC